MALRTATKPADGLMTAGAPLRYPADHKKCAAADHDEIPKIVLLRCSLSGDGNPWRATGGSRRVNRP